MMPSPKSETAAPLAEDCRRCGKPPSLCVCGAAAQPLANRIELLVLQHPQEQDRLLATARPAVLRLARASLKIGLSWPTLAKALGRPADPKRWAVLYLGSLSAALPTREVVAVDAKGAPLADQDRVLREIDGVIVLDGSWSQAKTLWWRNPWVLKCRRIVLNPKQRSLYGKLRREPRREGLATIEAAALALARLGDQPEIEAALRETFADMLRRYRAALTTPS